MALEPVAGQVYFSPEAHAAYAELGFNPSPGATRHGVALPDGPAYFASRGSLLGQVSGEVVAAAFGVFNPAAVVPAVQWAWTKVDAATICAARTRGGVASSSACSGPTPTGSPVPSNCWPGPSNRSRPEGKPLFAGLVALGLPGDPLGDMWRLADTLREYRGDTHIAAWTSAGLDATEVGLLTELYWHLPLRTYIRTRAWSDDDLDEAEGRLVGPRALADGALTAEGRAVREQVEVATDAQCQVVVDSLGSTSTSCSASSAPGASLCRDASAYPAQGPHDLAPIR